LSIPNLYYIENERTKNNSGTGAWNTGFDFLKNLLGEESYVAILDDDDEWETTHLESCIEK
jgi:glycosyltransferase involved in cell wall biosynthesis